MSRLNASDFDNVIDLIRAVYALGPLNGCGVTCGFQCSQIIDSLRRVVPSNTMTDAEVCDTLERGVRSGVFRRHNVSSDCIDPLDEEDALCGNNANFDATIVSLFHVNQQMVMVNNANKVYADYYNSRAGIPSDYADVDPSIGQYDGNSNSFCFGTFAGMG